VKAVPTALIVIKTIPFLLSIVANVFYLLSMLAGYRFFSSGENGEENRASEALPPVTIMIPLRGVDFGAYRNYASFCKQAYPEFQIVFGVQDAADPAVPLVKRLAADFPQCDIEVVVCAGSHGQNAKVSNLQNMLPRVKHEYIVIVDSDIRVGQEYLKNVVRPLANPKVGLVTCLYRAAETPDFGARLEAIAITGEVAAGVLMARMFEGGIKFALGATMATTRAKLDEIGGFAVLADYLADDFMLGKLISHCRYEVRLSRYVVETAMAPTGFMGMVRHQMRWARSTRASRPLGYFGLIVTYGTAMAVLTTIADGASQASLMLLGTTLAIRMAMAWLIGVHWLGDRILRRDLWLVPVRDLLSLVVWMLGLVGRKVEWRGRWLEVARGGKIVLAKSGLEVP
jgi:ceramide glucosyltransferase